MHQSAASAASAATPFVRQQYRPVFTAPSAIPKTISTLPDPAGAPEFLLTSNAGALPGIPFGPPSLGAENGPVARAGTAGIAETDSEALRYSREQWCTSRQVTFATEACLSTACPCRTHLRTGASTGDHRARWHHPKPAISRGSAFARESGARSCQPMDLPTDITQWRSCRGAYGN